jgi:hypothetical protein
MVNPLIDVVGEVGVAITVGAGLPGSTVHVPVPEAAIIAVEYWQVV